MDRWKTKFGAWVREYGVTRLQNALGDGVPVSKGSIYFWVRGCLQPRPKHAQQIVALSEGALTLDDVYAQQALAKGPGGWLQ